LAETLVITAVGGAIGIALSYAISNSRERWLFTVRPAMHAEAGDIRLIVAPKILLIATTILASRRCGERDADMLSHRSLALRV